MPRPLVITLQPSEAQAARLQALQKAFSEVCNALAPIVRDTRCWNRVALHHMAYRTLRERFPQMGSQMVCNAIYSVSRTSRRVYQSAKSPFNLARLGARPLPLIQFAPGSPVYFDRHTLSIKAGQLSMFTLDGRMRFDIKVSPQDELRFHEEKLQEVVLSSASGAFRLMFLFAQGPSATQDNEEESGEDEAAAGEAATDLPEYVVVLPQPAAPLAGETA